MELAEKPCVFSIFGDGDKHHESSNGNYIRLVSVDLRGSEAIHTPGWVGNIHYHQSELYQLEKRRKAES